MADKASPRRRSFLSKLFSKMAKHHNSSDAKAPPYESNTQVNQDIAVDSTKEDRTANSHLPKAEENIKDEETRLKDHLHKAGKTHHTSNEGSTRRYIEKAETAAKKEGGS